MEKTLEIIEKVWILIGTIATVIGITNQAPWVGEVFTVEGWQFAFAAISAVTTAFQFFRGKIADTEIISANGYIQATEEGSGYRTMNTKTTLTKLNTPKYHLLNPFSKRRIKTTA